jgi:hypothetical protein
MVIRNYRTNFVPVKQYACKPCCIWNINVRKVQGVVSHFYLLSLLGSYAAKTPMILTDIFQKFRDRTPHNLYTAYVSVLYGIMSENLLTPALGATLSAGWIENSGSLVNTNVLSKVQSSDRTNYQQYFTSLRERNPPFLSLQSREVFTRSHRGIFRAA